MPRPGISAAGSGARPAEGADLWGGSSSAGGSPALFGVGLGFFRFFFFFSLHASPLLLQEGDRCPSPLPGGSLQGPRFPCPVHAWAGRGEEQLEGVRLLRENRLPALPGGDGDRERGGGRPAAAAEGRGPVPASPADGAAR